MESRQEMPRQEPGKRIKNFKEVASGYTEEQALKEASRCIQCKKPTCKAGCPVEIEIPEFIKAIAEKDFAKAIEIIKQKNSLPAVCGRVCPQESQCEKVCALSKKYGSVAIGRLERFVADLQISNSINVSRPTNVGGQAPCQSVKVDKTKDDARCTMLRRLLSWALGPRA